MNQIPLLLCALMTAGAIGYVFYPPRHLEASSDKTRFAYLQERKDVVYENLRDLNFEYKAGKYPEADYLTMRAALEDEAAALLAELEVVETGAKA